MTLMRKFMYWLSGKHAKVALAIVLMPYILLALILIVS
jgi:hypothetical protein